MSRLLIPAFVLVTAAAVTGALAAWPSAWHQWQGLRALAHAESSGAAPDIERAVALLGTSLAENPLSRESRIGYARAIDLAIGRLGAEHMATVDPPSTLARAVVAAALDRRGAWTVARAVRSNPGVTRPEETALLDDAALTALGTVAGEAHDCRDALPLLDAASRRSARTYRVELARAICLNETGDAGRALPILSELAGQYPEARWVGFHLADAHLRLGQIDRAETVSRALVTRNRKFYFAWRQRGDILRAAHMPREAAFAYRWALWLRPQNRWLLQVARALDKQAAAAPPGPAPSPTAS